MSEIYIVTIELDNLFFVRGKQFKFARYEEDKEDNTVNISVSDKNIGIVTKLMKNGDIADYYGISSVNVLQTQITSEGGLQEYDVDTYEEELNRRNLEGGLMMELSLVITKVSGYTQKDYKELIIQWLKSVSNTDSYQLQIVQEPDIVKEKIKYKHQASYAA